MWESSGVIADEATNLKIKGVIGMQIRDRNPRRKKVHMDIFEQFPGQSKSDFFETKVNGP